MGGKPAEGPLLTRVMEQLVGFAVLCLLFVAACLVGWIVDLVRAPAPLPAGEAALPVMTVKTDGWDTGVPAGLTEGAIRAVLAASALKSGNGGLNRTAGDDEALQKAMSSPDIYREYSDFDIHVLKRGENAGAPFEARILTGEDKGSIVWLPPGVHFR